MRPRIPLIGGKIERLTRIYWCCLFPSSFLTPPVLLPPHSARRNRRHALSREGQDECPGSSSVRGARRWSETHTALRGAQARARGVLRQRPAGAKFGMCCRAAAHPPPAAAAARRRRALARSRSRARGSARAFQRRATGFPSPARERSRLISVAAVSSTRSRLSRDDAFSKLTSGKQNLPNFSRRLSLTSDVRDLPPARFAARRGDASAPRRGGG